MQVSVIVPVYNLEKYIVRTLESLKTSRPISYEIIVINDGSKDNSETVIKSYISKTDQNIKYLKQENSGVSVARNNGILNSKGDYIIFLDGDDFVEQDYIYRLYSVAKSNDCEIATCLYYHTKPDGTAECYDYNRYKNLPEIFSSEQFIKIFFLNTTILNTGSLIFKSSLIKDNNVLFDNKMTHCEDHKFFINTFLLSKQIYLLKDRLYNYYQRDESLTHDVDPVLIRDRVNFYTQLLKINKNKKCFSNEIVRIIKYYNIPEAAHSIFEIYSKNDQDDYFNRYHKRKKLIHYILIAVFFKYTPKKKRLIYLALAKIPFLYKKYCKGQFGFTAFKSFLSLGSKS